MKMENDYFVHIHLTLQKLLQHLYSLTNRIMIQSNAVVWALLESVESSFTHVAGYPCILNSSLSLVQQAFNLKEYDDYQKALRLISPQQDATNKGSPDNS